MNRDNMIIEVDELMNKLESPHLRIFDATINFFQKDGDATAFETYQHAHIPGAAFFEHQDFSDASSPYMYMALPEAALAEQIGKVGISAETEVVVYTSDIFACATRAWWLLCYAGHNNVRVLNGGLEAWKTAGGIVETGINNYAPTDFTCNLRPKMFASRADVLAALDNQQVCTVNTLNQKMYDQGHIRNSSLFPFDDLLDNMSRFLPDDVLVERLENEAKHERVITYCGGGIAATVNAMAHLMAGNPNVAVYDGSMDEWQKENMPIASNV